MWQSLKRLAELLSRRQRGYALLLVLMLIGNALLEMIGVGLVPVFIGILIKPDELLHNHQVIEIMSFLGVGAEHLTQKLLLHGGSVLLFTIFTFRLIYAPLLAYYRSRYIQGIVRSLGMRLFDSYMRAPYEFHLNRHSSELMRNVSTESMQLGDKVLGPLVSLVGQLLITIAIAALLIVSIPGPALLLMASFIGITIPVVGLLVRRIKNMALTAQKGRKHVIRNVQEGLSGVKEIKLLNRERYFVERYGSALRQVLILDQKIGNLFEAFGALIRLNDRIILNLLLGQIVILDPFVIFIEKSAPSRTNRTTESRPDKRHERGAPRSASNSSKA